MSRTFKKPGSLSAVTRAIVVISVAMIPAASWAVTPPNHIVKKDIEVSGVLHAERALNEAKTALEHTKDEYAGHKQKALDEINLAIQELRDAELSSKSEKSTR